MVADDGPRQTGIGYHAIFNNMAEFNEFGHIGCLYYFTIEVLTWFQVPGVNSEKIGLRTEC